MTINTGALQQLKDIHLPAPVSMWPQAPGWYVSAGILLVITIVACMIGLRKYYIYQRRYKTRKQLTMIMQNFTDKPKQCFEELSQFIRRLVLAHYKREQVASLQGEAWLKFLDNICETQDFSTGVGRILITAPYKKEVTADIHLLKSLMDILIKKML